MDASAKDKSVPQESDPLWHILMRLRIRRFITTNYDLEIWKDWWDGWQEKPAIREPAYDIHDETKTLMIRHYVKERDQPFPQNQDVDNLKAALKNTSKYVTIILGGEGTGKGYLATRLVKQPQEFLAKWPDSAKRFLGTTNFTNDLLSLIDSAQQFLSDQSAVSGDAVARLRSALKRSPHLLVIGGVQRMLNPPSLDDDVYEARQMNHPPFPVGQPINHEIRQFFEMVQELAESGPSHIVLTSSVWPSTLDPETVNVVRLEGVGADEVCKSKSYANIDDSKVVERLHHAVKGHAYAIAVIEKLLEAFEDPEEKKRWLRRLTSYLTAIDLTRRTAEVIKAVVREYRILWKAPPDDFIWTVMKRIALIGTPVNTQDIADTFWEEKGFESCVGRTIDRLVTAHLLLRLDRPSGKRPHYTAHTLVRAHVLRELGSFADTPGEPQKLGLSDFTSDVTVFNAGTHDGHAVSFNVIDALLTSAEKLPSAERSKRRLLPRAAFGLLRAHWTTTGVNRLAEMPLEEMPDGLISPHLDAFQRRMARLLNIIRGWGADLMWYSVSEGQSKYLRREGILYADELAWIYNEFGLSAYCQGALHDAYARFRIAQDINGAAEHGTCGPRWIQSEFNLGMVQLERGHLLRSRYHFKNAVAIASRVKDLDVAARARGYLGLVQHLSGDYSNAERLYTESLDHLAKVGNSRGLSIFRRHRCDLFRLRGNYRDAQRDIIESISAAETGRHPDLLHYSRVAAANLYRASAAPPIFKHTSENFLESARSFAKTVGLPKMEAEIASVRGIIALDKGDTQLAAKLAIKSLGIASLLGMRLRLTASLVFLGQVTRMRGELQAAVNIFRSAIELAKQQSYVLQLEKAERELAMIPNVLQV
ncbi:MAG: tetratricopeptide repeat protein [Methylococcales bacterium]